MMKSKSFLFMWFVMYFELINVYLELKLFPVMLQTAARAQYRIRYRP